MQELLNSAYAQLGAVGLLTVSGWMMWWLERQQRIAIQCKRDELLEKLMAFMEQQRDLLQDLVKGLDIKEMIRTEMRNYNENKASSRRDG